MSALSYMLYSRVNYLLSFVNEFISVFYVLCRSWRVCRKNELRNEEVVADLLVTMNVRMDEILNSRLFIPALSALVLLVVYVIYSVTFSKSSKKRRTVLLLGALDSGKTAILSSVCSFTHFSIIVL